MIATVTKNSGGTAWNIGDERNYDVWGGVRQGATTGGPKGRYCANLGHVQDDESGLVYMRARYYEPETGRFISEDKRGDGGNWYIYGHNNPLAGGDYSGNVFNPYDLLAFVIGAILIIQGLVLMGEAVIAMDAASALIKQINRIEASFVWLRGNVGDAFDEVNRFALMNEKNALNAEHTMKLREADGLKKSGFKKLGAGLTALMGYSMVLRGLIIDADLPGSDFDILSIFWGG